jgi:hypothetical protein
MRSWDPPGLARARRTHRRADGALDSPRPASTELHVYFAILPNAIAHALEIWLVMHEDLKATRRVRLLFDHLAAGLTDYVRGRSVGVRPRPRRCCPRVLHAGVPRRHCEARNAPKHPAPQRSLHEPVGVGARPLVRAISCEAISPEAAADQSYASPYESMEDVMFAMKELLLVCAVSSALVAPAVALNPQPLPPGRSLPRAFAPSTISSPRLNDTLRPGRVYPRCHSVQVGDPRKQPPMLVCP